MLQKDIIRRIGRKEPDKKRDTVDMLAIILGTDSSEGITPKTEPAAEPDFIRELRQDQQKQRSTQEIPAATALPTTRETGALEKAVTLHFPPKNKAQGREAYNRLLQNQVNWLEILVVTSERFLIGKQEPLKSKRVKIFFNEREGIINLSSNVGVPKEYIQYFVNNGAIRGIPMTGKRKTMT